jgi:sodium-dependent dicarboxylate transporter 2/3/5
MLVAVPLMAGVLLFTWMLLCRAFPPAEPRISLPLEHAQLTSRGFLIVAIFSVTVLLWLTGEWHGLPPALVALVPIVSLTASRVLTEEDLNGLDWPILILIAGGVSLGVGMQMSGLDTIVVQWLPFEAGDSPRALGAVLVLTVLVLGTFMSNTGVANLLLPVGVSMGVASGSAGLTVELALSIALAASLAMALPISTPPNAIAYARGAVGLRDMARIGVTVGALSGILIVAFGGIVVRFWGVI